MQGWATGVLLGCGVACAGTASRSGPPEPATDCAALWIGYADVTGDKGAHALGLAFAEVAARSAEDPVAALEAIAARRGGMALTAEAMIHLGDRASREVWESRAGDCDAYGLTEPETRALLRP